jgi:putative ABC transport system permease protein
MIVVATILALTGALAALFIWKPLVRRVVLRNIARRPREAALIVAGSIFGTAMLTGALVVGDSVQQSMRAAAAHRLGPVDEIAVVNDTTVADDIARNLAIMQPAGVDGAMVIETGEVLVRAGDRFVGRAGVVAFDQDPAAVLPDAATLRPPDGEVIVTDDLAARLDVRPGESVRIGSGEPMRIAAVVPPRGVAGFTLRPAADTLNVVMSRATYGRVVDFGAANGAVLVAISNTDGALDGARNTELATASVYGAGGTYVAALQPVKVEALAAAQAEGDALGQLLLVGALLGVIAGLLLLAGIFVMLADDRTAELGLLQALGMRRRTTIAVFVAEGACYALPAAVLGIGTGVALAALLLRTMNGWFSSGWRGESVHAQLHLTSGALESGLVLGVAAALLAVSLTAWRIARRSIATAQRGGAVDHRSFALPPADASLRIAGIAALFFVWMTIWERPAGMMLCVLVGCLACTPWLAERWKSLRRAFAVTAACAIVLGLAVTPYTRARNIVVQPQLLALQGIIAAVLAVGALTMWQVPLGRALTRIRRRAVSLRLAVAYPQTHPGRTGLNVGLFTVVTFTVVFAIITSAGTTQNDPGGRKAGGGYDMLATTGVGQPAPVAALAASKNVAAVAPLASTRARVHVNNAKRDVDRTITVFDASLVKQEPPHLLDRGAYRSDAAAFRAVLKRPDLVIVSETLLAPLVPRPVQRVRPGDRLLLTNPAFGSAREVQVAATYGLDTLSLGILTSRATAAAALGSVPEPDRFLIATRSGRAATTATTLANRFRGEGVEVTTTAAVVDGVAGEFGSFTRALQVAQALALIAGLCGLAVVMARSVRERRRDLGTFRALGATRGAMSRAIALETVFVAAQGLVLGVVLATVTSYAGQGSIAAGVSYVYPLRSIVMIVLGVLGITVLAAVVPARLAARCNPASALRIAE